MGYDISIICFDNSGIKIIMDYVPNHTSIQHPWFRLSREGGEHSPYRDYYIWSKGKATIDGLKVPPNNWVRLDSEKLITGQTDFA